MKFWRSKGGLAAIAALLLILFVYRPGVHRLSNRIANSIGSALGRRVAIDNVRLRVLPRPGFDLEGLVIYDDPAYSAEPMIRAQDVTAAIRLRSLLRGRIEIATLSATEPSINIVRNQAGRWNLTALLERNAQIPAAPTQKTLSERRPAFPYLEATSARINFKIGAEKKSYTLIDADVALWQESENTWGARMKAQPVRTDFNLTDTGRLQMNAAWQRSTNLRQTPLRVSIAWQNGQLGQITQLLTGLDRGWRGGLSFTADLSGTPDALAVESRVSVAGFRRYDIVDSRIVNLATHCTGNFGETRQALTDLVCESPVQEGMIRVRGTIGAGAAENSAPDRSSTHNNPPVRNRVSARDPQRPIPPVNRTPAYDLTLSAEKIPLASLLALVHQAKQQLPPDLTATGLLDAEFHAVSDGSRPPDVSGNGAAKDVQLLANGGKDAVALGDIPLALIPDSGCCQSRAASSKRATKTPGDTQAREAEPAAAHLRIGPATLRVNTSAPLNTAGWLSASDYSFFLRGDIALKNLFRLESVLGLPSVRPAADGDARLDLSISGAWKGLAAPNALGTAQLRNIRAETRGLNTPIEISSATVLLAPDVFSLQKISAQTGVTNWTGSVTAPRHCAPSCLFDFDLTADQLSSDDLAGWFTAHPAKHPWYRLLSSSSQQGPSPLLPLQARGSLHVAQLALKKFVATQVSARVSLDRGKIALTNLHAAIMQGTHQGSWTVDASSWPLKYRGDGALQGISLAQLSMLMNDAWIAGNLDGTFEVETSGENFPELLANSAGNLRFAMHNGSLAHMQIPGAPGPMPVHRFVGTLQAKSGVWKLADGRLESRDGLYEVSGTAAPKAIHFVLTRGDEQSWNVTGTLIKPAITPTGEEISRTEAGAKTEIKP